MNNDKIMVHRTLEKLDSYEIWRKEKAREYGETPQAQTLVSELHYLKMFKEAAVRKGFLTLSTMPEIR